MDEEAPVSDEEAPTVVLDTLKERVTCCAFVVNIAIFVCAFVVPVVVANDWDNNYSYYPLFCFLWAISLLGYLVPPRWDGFFYAVDARVLEQGGQRFRGANPRDKFFGRAIMVASSAVVWFLAMSAGRELTGVEQTPGSNFAIWGIAAGVGLLTAISLEFRVMLISIPLTVMIIGVFVSIGSGMDSTKWIGAIVAMSVGGFLVFGCLIYHCLKTIFKDALYRVAEIYYLIMLCVAVATTPVVLFVKGDRFAEFCKLKIEEYYQLGLAVVVVFVLRSLYNAWLQRFIRNAKFGTRSACRISCFCMPEPAPVARK